MAICNTKWNLTDETEELVMGRDPFTIEYGNIRIENLHLKDMGSYYEILFVIVNGISKELLLFKVPFLLFIDNKIKKEFVHNKRLALPPNSSTPIMIKIDKNKINIHEFSDWSVEFKYYYGSVQLDSRFAKKLSDEERLKIIENIEEIPRLSYNEIRLYGTKCNLGNEGNLLLQVLIGNGYPKQVSIKKLPITIHDRNDSLVTATTFNTVGLTIEPNAWRMVHLVVPKNKLGAKDFDLTSWKLGTFRPIQLSSAPKKIPLH